MSEWPSFPRSRTLAVAVLLVLCVAFVYWPGVHGFWGRDDFMQLAFARMIGSPWVLFTHDHYPVPGSVFRPLGFASMWLCATLLGTGYESNAIADLALHAGVSVLLLFLLIRAAIPRPLAVLASLLFALHPAVIGTALWWSARFDLLSTFFILLALLAAFEYRQRVRTYALPCALFSALAAMLSKEIGLAVIAALSLLWLRWAWIEPANRSRALRALLLTWLVAASYLAWRWHVLGTLSSGLVGATPLHALLAKGLLDWLHQAPGYWSFWERLHLAPRIALLVSLVLFVLGIVIASLSARERATWMWKQPVDLVLCGLTLFLLPALLQAPIAASNAAPLAAGASAIETAMQSRLYYLGIAGAAIASAAILAEVWRVGTTYVRVLVATALSVCVVAFGAVSHSAARAFAKRSVVISAVARDAVAAVQALDLPASRCHVVFLDIDPAPEWSIYVSMDSIIKALSPDLGRVQHCYFHADYVTYFHLLAGAVDPADVAPYRPVDYSGNAVEWMHVGDLTIAYVGLPETVTTGELAQMTFLRYRDGRFENVSEDVAAGRLSVHPQ